MDILDDMGVSKLSAKVFSKVNYSFKKTHFPGHGTTIHSKMSSGSAKSTTFSRIMEEGKPPEFGTTVEFVFFG